MERIRNYKYYSLFQNILKFEIFYKMMTLFILSPILRRILQEYLDSVTYGIAFNQDIIYQFLSFKGIVICLFLFILMILIIFYEIYVVMNIIALDKEHKKLSLRKIMLKSFCSLKSLHYPSLPLCGIYIVFLLPLVHIGYLNSYIQRWDIPNFIFGELKLTLGGNVLICLVSIIYYLIFIIMIFVPVYMVFKGKSIISATQESFSLFKKITLKEKGSLLVYLLLWIFIEYM
ncbi:MAG: glycerophosphoryl diester phosphodiesterase membrane domain-containing protein, partial [Coprobacillus cateniformis]